MTDSSKHDCTIIRAECKLQSISVRYSKYFELESFAVNFYNFYNFYNLYKNKAVR